MILAIWAAAVSPNFGWEFKPKGDGSGILQVGAADLDDLGELEGLGMKGVSELLHRGNKVLTNDRDGGNIHRRGEGVVRRLRHVHIVVGMNRLLGAEDSSGHLDGPVGDHLVGVHVALGAASGLPDAKREVGVEFSFDYFIGGTGDEVGLLGGKLPKIPVRQGAGLLELAKCLDQLGRFGVVADVEMNQRPGRLRPVVAVMRHGDLPHRVALGTMGRRIGGSDLVTAHLGRRSETMAFSSRSSLTLSWNLAFPNSPNSTPWTMEEVAPLERIGKEQISPSSTP